MGGVCAAAHRGSGGGGAILQAGEYAAILLAKNIGGAVPVYISRV